MFWGEKQPVKWRSKQMKIFGTSPQHSARQGNLAPAPLSPETQGTPSERELQSWAKKNSFVSASLAGLPMDILSFRQENMCCVMYSCHAGWWDSACVWKTGGKQAQCSPGVGSPFVKGLLLVARMTGWQKSGLSGASFFLIPNPTQEVCLVKKLRLMLPQGPAMPPYWKEKTSSCLLLQNDRDPG